MSTCAYALRARALEEQHKQKAKKQLLQLLLILSVGILINPLNTTLSPLLDNYQAFPPDTWSGFLPVIETAVFILVTLTYGQLNQQKPRSHPTPTKHSQHQPY